MKCVKCGNELPDGDKFCIVCGYPVEAVQPSPKLKKKRRGLVALLWILAVLGMAALCIAIFLPGFFRPKDLGVKTSKAAYESAITKLNYVKDTSPSTGTAEDYSYIYGSLKKLNASFTSEELTSFFNYNRPKYYALKKVQIRINPDNTIDFSAAIDTAYFLNKVLGGKYSKQEITKTFPMIKVIPGSVNIYTRISGEIAGNKSLDFTFLDIEVMGIDLPSKLYATQTAKTEIRSIVDNFLSRTTEKTKGTYKSIKVENGELAISGNLPSSLKREEVK